jgi:diketogulonate reductase-like aldo/keto reductase
VLELVRSVGETNERTPSQVALRWLVQKGAVPIPGAKNQEQASLNAGALGWELSATDMTALDAVALEGRRTIHGRVFQHG